MSRPNRSGGETTTADNSRAVAWRALQAVHIDGAYANLALPPLLAQSSLDLRDRGFVTELVYGALRREGELDVVIENAAHRETGSIDAETLDVLRSGVYQALFMRVSVHAVVNESVRLTKTLGLQRSSGFVNAVLRSVTTKPKEHWQDLIIKDTSIVVSHPAWIASEIEQALLACEGVADLPEALAAHNEAPGVTLVLLPGLADFLPADEKTPWSDRGVHLPGGDPGLDHRVAEGSARVQDEGSQLAATVLARMRPLQQGERILDMCAGPGGKTAVLAGHALMAGAHVTAIEKVPHRAGLVRDSTRAITDRDPSVVEVLVADATKLAEAQGEYDRILLDAPCTGLGALRRRPEARWRKSAGDIEELHGLQVSLLRAGVDALAPGGVLAYVTCSPVTRETTDVVSEVLSTHPEMEALDTASLVDSVTRTPLPGSRRGSAVQLWTHRHGTDAMFIQLLTKTKTG